MRKICVDEATRLDVFLAKCLKSTRSQVSALIKNGGVKCNGKACEKSSFKLKMGDELEIFELLPQNPTPKYAVNFDIAVLYEDEDILVLNKPAGVVVHSASSVKEATLVDWLLERNYTLSTLGGQVRAGLVHRLDKGTSGAIIIAKNNASHEHLSKQLQNKALGRFYLALTNLPLKNDKMIIEKALIRCPKNRLKKMAVNGSVRGARAAKSAFVNLLCGRDLGLNLSGNSNENSAFGVNLNENSNLNSGENLISNENSSESLNSNKTLNLDLNLNENSSKNSKKSLNSKPNSSINLIAAKLFTGRTHQIRAHLESLNRHILGDKLYGYKGKNYERVMLHAYFLYFTHPKTSKQMLVKAPIFEDFERILKHFDKGELDEKLSFDYIRGVFDTLS